MSTYLVSYSDTDAGGVLHHAKYIEIAERGYHWWLKDRNMSFRKLNRDHNLSLVVYDLSAKYKSAIFLEDEIRIRTRLIEINRKGLQWATNIAKSDDVCFSLLTKMVCLNNETKTIISVPDFLISKFENEVEIA
jgi:acyl-CoA thioester hydrolase